MSTVVELVKRNFELQNELETSKKENEQLKKGMSAMLTKNNETINYLNKELGSTKRLLSEIVEMNAELKKENARLRKHLDFLLDPYSAPEEVMRRRFEIYETLRGDE